MVWAKGHLLSTFWSCVKARLLRRLLSSFTYSRSSTQVLLYRRVACRGSKSVCWVRRNKPHLITSACPHALRHLHSPKHIHCLRYWSLWAWSHQLRWATSSMDLSFDGWYLVARRTLELIVSWTRGTFAWRGSRLTSWGGSRIFCIRGFQNLPHFQAYTPKLFARSEQKLWS